MSASPSAIPGSGRGRLDDWVFRDREAVEGRFGIQIDRLREMLRSDEGRRTIMEEMHRIDNGLNGQSEQALRQLDRNIDQIKKKESFLTKMAKAPFRACKKAVECLVKHPVLSSAAIIAILIAILYFTPTLAPTAGEYGNALIERFKEVLRRFHIASPEIATDAVGKVAVTGGPVSESVAEVAREVFVSPGSMTEQTGEFLRSAADPTIVVPDADSALSSSAKQILQTAPVAPGVPSVIMPEITDPLQRALRGLEPLK